MRVIDQFTKSFLKEIRERGRVVRGREREGRKGRQEILGVTRVDSFLTPIIPDGVLIDLEVQSLDNPVNILCTFIEMGKKGQSHL